ncbi:MAG: GTP:adenosylcobinamide-phosphate guanylyltransferase [Gammaproteobacteria bacterium]|jgi:GTP:adenosylcobinamide-phosphate guanylyltransferase
MLKQSSSTAQFVAIVLAGDRNKGDPVAVDAGVSCKAITPICGRPMILRVLNALEESTVIRSIVLCGPPQASLKDCPELVRKIEQSNIKWLPNLDSPSRSVEAALQEIDNNEHVLLTTADHALLQSEMVNYFVSQSINTKADACVGLVEYKTISDVYPEVKRTVIKLSDGGFCGCNLFTFINSKGRKLVPFWRQVEQSRKKPVKMIAGILGVQGVLLYVLGKLSLKSALAKVSDRLQIDIKPVLLPFPDAGVDVDTVKDRQFVEKILQSSGLE